MRDDLHIDIQFHEQEDQMELGLGDWVRGQIVLTPRRDLQVEQAGYKVMVEARLPFPHQLPGSIVVGNENFQIQWIILMKVKTFLGPSYQYHTAIRVYKIPK